MAGLRNLQIANSYKDLLTILDSTNPNQGLESTSKRVFDGDGVQSPLFLSTTAVDIAGNLTSTGTITGNTLFSTDGNISSNQTELSLKSGSTELFKIKTDGTVRTINVSNAPTNPSAGDLVNLNGHLYMAIAESSGGRDDSAGDDRGDSGNNRGDEAGDGRGDDAGGDRGDSGGDDGRG